MVALDLGGKESQICIRQPDGAIVEERRSDAATTSVLSEVVGFRLRSGPTECDAAHGPMTAP